MRQLLQDMEAFGETQDEDPAFPGGQTPETWTLSPPHRYRARSTEAEKKKRRRIRAGDGQCQDVGVLQCSKDRQETDSIVQVG